MVIWHLLSSSSVSANSLWVSANFSISSSFSSLQMTLMHFGGGRCCFGCLAPKCGCAGGTVFGVIWTGPGIVADAPRISVITNSSCWAIMFTSFCLISVDALGLFSFSFPLVDDFLLFFAVWRQIKQKLHQLCHCYTKRSHFGASNMYLASFKLFLKSYENKNYTSHHTCSEFNNPSVQLQLHSCNYNYIDVPWCLWFDKFFVNLSLR